AVTNVSFLLIREDSRCGCGTVSPIGSDGRAVQLDQRLLDLADVLSPRTRHDVRGVRHGGRFEFRVITEQLRLKGHKSLLLEPPNALRLTRGGAVADLRRAAQRRRVPIVDFYSDYSRPTFLD